MNGKEQAKEKIIEFLKSNEKVMILTGTHQYNKHKLVMAILNNCYKNAKILFRVNGLSNLTNDVLDDLTVHKDIGKIFLISWTDKKDYDYTKISHYFERHIIYDAEEENIAYHKRVLDLL